MMVTIKSRESRQDHACVRGYSRVLFFVFFFGQVAAPNLIKESRLCEDGHDVRKMSLHVYSPAGEKLTRAVGCRTKTNVYVCNLIRMDHIPPLHKQP